MKPYSYKHKVESILNEKKVDFVIPGGNSTRVKDWFPFVMYFNADKGFSRYSGKHLSLTILYNFGHFEILKGSSSYYNPTSSYFSSFYGGYAVYNNEDPDNKYGFNSDGTINVNEINLIPKYDQIKLVLPSLGCPTSKRTFDSEINNIIEDVSYIEMNGWVRIDSTITTNSPVHKSTDNQRGYIQYGKPIEKYYIDEDFPVTTLKGRVYVKYVDEFKMTFVLYILAPNVKTLDECDKEILSKSKIKSK